MDGYRQDKAGVGEDHTSWVCEMRGRHGTVRAHLRVVAVDLLLEGAAGRALRRLVELDVHPPREAHLLDALRLRTVDTPGRHHRGRAVVRERRRGRARRDVESEGEPSEKKTGHHQCGWVADEAAGLPPNVPTRGAPIFKIQGAFTIVTFYNNSSTAFTPRFTLGLHCVSKRPR